MNDPVDPPDEDTPMTLDPPGSIAVVGAGVLGVEAALYGRFLGYDVTLVEAVSVGSSLMQQPDAPLPLLPDRCLSALALAALQAQTGQRAPPALPTTVRQWVDQVLVPLTESDLLRGRLKVPLNIAEIALLPVEADDQEGEDELPADFRLIAGGGDGETGSIDVEAVILAVGNSDEIRLGFPTPAPYFFRVGRWSPDDWEQDLRRGLREVVAIFAGLAGRSELDLYRPRRV